MFNDDDVNHMMNSNTRVPDGVINGLQYAEIFKELNGYLESTNTQDFQSGIRWIMNCVNACYEEESTEFSKSRAADVVTALAYFCMTMQTGLTALGQAEEYFRHQNEEVIPQLFAECESIPWYDFSEEVKMLAAMDNDDENGEDSIGE